MRSIFLTCLFALAATSTARGVSFYEVVSGEWESWKAQHGRNYTDPTEDKFRLKIYMENKVKVESHNRLANLGQKSYFQKLNKYSDLLPSEFKR